MVEVSSQKVSFSWKKVVRKNKTLSLTFLQKCLFVEKRQCKKTLFSRFCLALPTLSYATIVDYLRELSNSILGHYLRLS